MPPEVDVTRLPWLPTPFDWFLSHPFALLASAEPFRCLLLLIGEARRQVPAMSLPNNDAALAKAAGFGRDLAGWLQVREPVMSDWELCSDDRWHHRECSKWVLHSWTRIQATERFSEQQRQRALAGVRSRGAARAQPIEEKETEIGDEDKIADETPEKKRVETDEPRLAPSTLNGGGQLTISEAGNQEVSQSVAEDAAVEIVFEHWKRATGRPKESLTADRKKIVQARLRENMSPEVLCRAIDSASRDDFYLGHLSKQPRRIDTLDVILKDQDRVLRLASAGDPAQGPVLNQAAAATARTVMKMFGGRSATGTVDATVVDISQVTTE